VILTKQTRIPKIAELEERWLVVDAAGKTLGRLATHVATRLRGKHRPTFTPHLDTGDHVIVVNAAQVRVTGQKGQQKLYRRHTGYPGGLKEIPFERMLERHPDRVIRMAVSGMLPKNRLGRKLLKKLKVYAGPEHPHQAQQPMPEDLAGKA
jgi:large subunit ribosomal protein L13